MDKGSEVIDLFAGCGGLSLGFEAQGFKTIGYEINQDFCDSYNSNLKGFCYNYDLSKSIEFPQADVVIGGPPCQSFSLVGKRLEEDPRGKLVFAFYAALEAILPRVFVMENVPGLTASFYEGERLTDYLAKRFFELGYEIQTEKLLATDFFVPQNRKRIVMIGRKKGIPKISFPSKENFAKLLGEPDLVCPVTVADALDDLPNLNLKMDYSHRRYEASAHSPYARLMRLDSNGTVSFHAMPTMSRLDKEFIKYIPPGGNYRNIPDSISTKRIKKFKASGGRTTTYGRLHPNRPAYTINTYFNRPNVGANYHHKQERLITVREAMRLQSFPDKFEPKYSNQRAIHEQIGNAVPPLMSRAIAHAIADALAHREP